MGPEAGSSPSVMTIPRQSKVRVQVGGPESKASLDGIG